VNVATDVEQHRTGHENYMSGDKIARQMSPSVNAPLRFTLSIDSLIGNALQKRLVLSFLDFHKWRDFVDLSHNTVFTVKVCCERAMHLK
jgi:hypothetical protein